MNCIGIIVSLYRWARWERVSYTSSSARDLVIEAIDEGSPIRTSCLALLLDKELVFVRR